MSVVPQRRTFHARVQLFPTMVGVAMDDAGDARTHRRRRLTRDASVGRACEQGRAISVDENLNSGVSGAKLYVQRERQHARGAQSRVQARQGSDQDDSFKHREVGAAVVFVELFRKIQALFDGYHLGQERR